MPVRRARFSSSMCIQRYGGSLSRAQLHNLQHGTVSLYPRNSIMGHARISRVDHRERRRRTDGEADRQQLAFFRKFFGQARNPERIAETRGTSPSPPLPPSPSKRCAYYIRPYIRYICRCASGRCTTTAFDRDTQPFLCEETSYAMRVN